jgi:hypothetical protein
MNVCNSDLNEWQHNLINEPTEYKLILIYILQQENARDSCSFIFQAVFSLAKLNAKLPSKCP